MIGHLITVLAIPKIHVMTPHYLLDQMENNFLNKILNGNKLFSFVSGCSSRTNVLPNQEDSKILQKKLKIDLYLDHDSRVVTLNRYTKHINKIIRLYNAYSHILKGTYVNDSNDLRMWKFSIS